jgi:signal transduction histidine kinase
MFRRALKSSSFQLGLIYLVLFAGSVLMLLGFIYWTTAGYMARQSDQTIQAEIEGLSERYRREGLEALARLIAQRVARDPGRSSVYLLTRPDYQRITGNLNAWPEVPVSTDGWVNFTLEVGPDKQPHMARARTFLLRGRYALLVGRDIHEQNELQTLMRQSLVWGVGLTLVLGVVGGMMLASSTMRRIEAINQTGRRIMRGDLAQRIPTSGSGDDFDQLADNLNVMLAQIEQLMSGVQHVSDNIAHDLRTPLTRLRARLERMQLNHARTTSETSEPGSEQSIELGGELGVELGLELSECIAEADQLLMSFNALLRISQLESGARVGAMALIDLSTLVGDACELYEAAAEQHEQAFSAAIADDISLHGDRDLLFQALSNLLDNAVKYAAGEIYVRLMQGPAGPLLSVADNGPGIPEAEYEKVGERFYRLEASRNTPGNGLGLSMVKAVARAHDAEFRLADNEPGLKVTLAFVANPRANTK